MLVLDLADDLLDDVLDCHQALGSAEFVDDDPEVDSRGAHPGEQLDDAHRFGDEQRLAHQRRDRTVARRVDAGDEHVLDVDHADHLIEALAIDGQAAVAGVGERADEVVEADAARHGDDVTARDANVARGLLAKVQQVAQHLPLGRAEVARDRMRAAAFLRLVDRVLDLRAQGRLGLRRRRSGGACSATAESRLRRLASPSGGHLIGIGDTEPGKRTDLARFHVRGIAFVVMIVAEEVERAMDQKMRRMILDAGASSRRLRPRRRRAPG